MRQIGTLSNRADARRFASYLIVQGIEAHSEEEGNEWAVWVRDEDQLDRARSALADFRADPRQEKFVGVEQSAHQLRQNEETKRQAARQNVVTMGQRWRKPGGGMRRPLTLAVVIACGIIGVTTNMGRNHTGTWMRLLLFCDVQHTMEDWTPSTLENKLIDVRSGQLWRIITPAFVHYGALHLAFNVVMFYQLGSRIEHRLGSWRLALLMLAIAVPSNLAQALAPDRLGGSVFFAGLSGVVFGLLGYLWMKSLFSPESGLSINQGTIMLALIFLSLGFLGVLDSERIRIANLAHGVGFAAGIIIGWFPAALRTP